MKDAEITEEVNETSAAITDAEKIILGLTKLPCFSEKLDYYISRYKSVGAESVITELYCMLANVQPQLVSINVDLKAIKGNLSLMYRKVGHREEPKEEVAEETPE